MAVYERSTLLRSKDDNGDEYLLYPITKLDCVDGAEDLVRVDKEQELTAAQKAQVLKNIGGLCAPVSAQVDKFLKVSAVDENGNVTAVEAVSVTQANENLDEVLTQQAELISELETALINKASGGGASGDVSWEDIHNKPFGETTELVDLLPTTTFDEFTLDSSFGVYAQGVASSYELVLGETYKVIWDGVEYECVAQDASALWSGMVDGVVVAMGNGSAFGMTGNDEPFIVAVMPTGYTIYVALNDTEEGGSHEVRIARDKPTVKYLDNKYLEFMSVASGSGKELMPERTLTFVPDDVPEEGAPVEDIAFFGGASVTEGDPLLQFEPNKQYTITFDGVEYTCAAIDLTPLYAPDPSEVPDGVKILALGNLGIFGAPGFSDTGEPFGCLLEYSPAIDGEPEYGSFIVVITHTSADASVDIKVSIKEAAGKTVIKSEYLPDNLGGVTSWNDLEDKPFGYGDQKTTVIIEQAVLPFEYDPDLTGGYSYIFTPSAEQLALWQSDWDNATVTYNGTVYVCEPKDMTGMKVIGNVDLLMGTGDNGIPFVITVADAAMMGEDIGIIMSVTDFPSDPENASPITYNVGCRIASTEIIPIDPKFIDDVSWDKISDKPFYEMKAGTVVVDTTTVDCNTEFDGMYMATIDEPDIGAHLYVVEFDGKTYELQGAAEGEMVMLGSDDDSFIILKNWFLGNVVVSTQGEHTFKITLAEDVVQTIDPKFLPSDLGGGSGGSAGNPLPEINGSGSDNGKVLTVNGTKVEWKAPVSKLPEVSTADAGKFLRVSVTGTWVAETIPNAEGARF